MVLILLVHIAFISASFILLAYAIWSHGRKRKVFIALFAIVCGSYLLSFCNGYYQKSKIEASYIGQYGLAKYKNCNNCTLELYPDLSYKVYSTAKTYETGNWEYADDGDHSFIKFANGGELGLNEYQLVK